MYYLIKVYKNNSRKVVQFDKYYEICSFMLALICERSCLYKIRKSSSLRYIAITDKTFTPLFGLVFNFKYNEELLEKN